MQDVNPIAGIFSVIVDQLEDGFDNPGEIYESWRNVKEDHDDFRHTYTQLKENIKKIVSQNGN